MNKSELTKAFEIAQKPIETDMDKINSAIAIFDGFGLSDFQPVHVTLRQIAILMRWQALYFNGDWDMKEINDIAYVGRKKFIVIGS
jgi:hypothetical protein